MARITQHLWFEKDMEAALNCYVALIPGSSVNWFSELPADTPSGPAGSVKLASFTLGDQRYAAIEAGPLDPFNHSFSVMVECDDQAEVDRLWGALSEGGEAEQCGWLRAAVLGANDGIVSTASLLLGVAAASASHSALMIAGVAGWVAGAMSMATGEYVSVSSQADTEKAALAEEQAELLEDYPGEFRELTSIYVHRGLDPALARQVAEKLMAHDALEAHARDELGISSATRARPLQAALASALSFSLGALLPLLVALWVPVAWTRPALVASALISLGVLGGIAAKTGGAPILPGVARILIWSALAMAVSSGVGLLFGVTAG